MGVGIEDSAQTFDMARLCHTLQQKNRATAWSRPLLFFLHTDPAHYW